jgi:hypothetical protein
VAEVTAVIGRALAEYHAQVEPALWADLLESGVFADAPLQTARAEWECLALHACVRGLVAASGFGDTTADTLDAMHERVLEAWTAEDAASAAARRERVAARYDEYGRIGQERESDGPGAVASALGLAASAHVFEPRVAGVAAASMLAGLHEAMTEGAAEVVRRCLEDGA